MKKFGVVFFTLVVFGCTAFFTHTVYADSFVVIKTNGSVVANVLADSIGTGLQIPQQESVEISHIANSDSNLDSHVSLTSTSGKISLVISTQGGEKEFDVTDWKDNLVEIEERGEVQKLTIRAAGSGFKIEQNGLTVNTNFPLNVDPKTNKISVETQSGERFISIMPTEALTAVLRAKTLTRLTEKESISLGEENGKDLYYLIKGKKEINLFNFYNLPVDISAKVSASTGEIISVDEPPYMRILRVLFS